MLKDGFAISLLLSTKQRPRIDVKWIKNIATKHFQKINVLTTK